jgi:hypothetical protein
MSQRGEPRAGGHTKKPITAAMGFSIYLVLVVGHLERKALAEGLGSTESRHGRSEGSPGLGRKASAWDGYIESTNVGAAHQREEQHGVHTPRQGR